MERVVLRGILAPCSAAQRHNLQILCLHAAIKELLLLISASPSILPWKTVCLRHVDSHSHFPQISRDAVLCPICKCHLVYTAFFPILSSNLTPVVYTESLITDRSALVAIQALQCPLLQLVSLQFPAYRLTHSNHLCFTLARRKVLHSIRNKRQCGLDDCVFITVRVSHIGDSHL